MKVINPGKKFEPFEISCKSCDADLMVESTNDLKRVYGGDQRESWDYLTAECPECNHRIQIAGDKVPEHIRETIRT